MDDPRGAPETSAGVPCLMDRQREYPIPAHQPTLPIWQLPVVSLKNHHRELCVYGGVAH